MRRIFEAEGWLAVVSGIVAALVIIAATSWVTYSLQRWLDVKPCAPTDLTALWGKAIVNDGTGTPKLLDAGWAASVERLGAERDKARAKVIYPASLDTLISERIELTRRAHLAEADRDKWKALALAAGIPGVMAPSGVIGCISPEPGCHVCVGDNDPICAVVAPERPK